jgi:steroid 5-alpha reductase family enzyme
MQFLNLYASAAATVTIMILVLWTISVAVRDTSIIDVFWGPLFVAIAWVLLSTHLATATSKQLLVVLLVTLWGLRLGLHLGTRNLGRGEDSRYRVWRQHGGPHWWLASLYRVYLLQGVIALIVATPIVAAFRDGQPPQFVNWLGVGVWAAGFAAETIADVQLIRFKMRPVDTAAVLDTGLWRYSRHPNYFGDALQWWGLGLLTFSGTAWWSFIGPLTMTLVFLNLSNDAIERGLLKRRPDYARYVQRTSAFFPKPPAGADDAQS